jgi:3'-phosphoadenosine 5'-phosphosulfate sulfotransferase (PAPS reductase)/FAD synthetase
MKIKMEWKLRSKTFEYKRHLDQAKRIIYNALEKGNGVISWSSGKDSTAMTHLIKSISPEIPIIIQFDDCDWPEKKLYVERVSQTQNWNYHVAEPDFSVWGKSFEYKIGDENICSQNHIFTQESFLSLLRLKQNELGCDLIFLGLRAEESHSRYLNIIKRGSLYQVKNEDWHCLPLANWSVEDVFAYLVENDIEINPCYFHNRFYPPEKIRLSWAIPTQTGIRYGDLEHIRFYYPEQFQRLRDRGIVV